MSLTGVALPIVLGVVAVVLLALIVCGKPACRTRRAGMAARGGMSVAFTAAVLALVAALFNNEYAFYTSWSDLVGAPSQETQTQYGALPKPMTAFGQVTTSAVTAAVLPPLPQPGARLQHYVVPGPRNASGAAPSERKVIVRLPVGYDATKATTYPVIVAMHGLPATPQSFGTLGGFYPQLDEAERTGRIRPSIVVVPQLNDSPRSDDECVDWPGGAQTETWLAETLPAWTRAHFRASEGRSSWATWGYSYGGWCASMVAMKHPETFGAAVVFQGYFRASFPEKSPFAEGSEQARSYDLGELARTKAPDVAMWVFASQSDGASYPSTKRFLHEVRAPLSVHACIGKGGGHRTSVWTRHISRTFTWLGGTLDGFWPLTSQAPEPRPGDSPSPSPGASSSGGASSEPGSHARAVAALTRL